MAPGGLLLVVGHCGFPSWAEEPHPDVHFPTPQEVLVDLAVDLALPDGGWTVERLESTDRPATGPDGKAATLTDAVVAVRRLDG